MRVGKAQPFFFLTFLEKVSKNFQNWYFFFLAGSALYCFPFLLDQKRKKKIKEKRSFQRSLPNPNKSTKSEELRRLSNRRRVS
jgi:hypothetical protein